MAESKFVYKFNNLCDILVQYRGTVIDPGFIKHNELDSSITLASIQGKFRILEVDRWTWTPILSNIGTFTVTLSTYILIESHIKGAPINSSDKDAWISIGCI